MNNRTENVEQFQYEDEITLKELIIKIKEFFFEVVKFWKLLLLLAVLFALIMGYRAYTSEVSYSAKLTYMVNKNEGSGLGAIGGILGQFGFNSKSGSNKEQIISLSKSRKVIEKMMFEKVTINDKKDYIANHLITHLDSIGKWYGNKLIKGKKHPLNGFKFKGHFSYGNDTVGMAIKTIYSTIVGGKKTKGCMSTGYNEDSGILHINTTLGQQELAADITNVTFDKLSDYYVKKTIEAQKSTYDIIKFKTDSIAALLKIKENSLANVVDKTHFAQTSKVRLKESRLKRDVMKLSTMYGESLKNLELADFSLKTNTPFVQVIDRPLLPLSGNKPSLIKSLIIGIFLGLFMGAFFVIARKIYREAME